MRLGILAHDFKALRQAEVENCPVGHSHLTLAVMGLCVTMLLISSPVWAEAPQSRCARIGQKWMDFWNGKIDNPFEVFTEDVVYEDLTLDVHVSGSDGTFLAFAQGIFDAFPNSISRFEVGQSSCRGQQGFLEWTWIGEDGSVNPPAPGFCGTGKPFTVRGVAVIATQGKRISHNTDVWDLATMLRQLLPEGQECVARLLGFSEE